ncbi:NADH-quinone oxidoreductase subunit NuoI [Helicobacter sp. 23-1045]
MSYKLINSPEKPSFMRFVKRTFGLDLLKGLKITLVEFFSPKTIATIKYPLEKIPLSPRYRAIHKLMRLLESGNERCIGCGLCEKICISNCIKIETSYGADSRKKITSYTINFGRCIYCGFCAEVCPEIAIIHGERYENSSEQRAHFANKEVMLTPLDLALRGDICEFAGFGAVSENADSSVKQTPTGYIDGNSSLGMQFAPFSHKTSLDEPQVLSRSFHAKTAQSHTANTRIDSKENADSAKTAESNEKNADSTLDSANRDKSAESAKFAESQNPPSLAEGARGWVDSANAESNEIKSVRSTESRPLRGAKNREQGCSSATADFLLEAEKRGSPPKSEKRELLARRGSGAGGAALLREESSESNDKNSENIADSAKQTKFAESNPQSTIAQKGGE